MDSISKIISIRADNLFHSPTFPATPSNTRNNEEELIIDLEAPLTTINNESRDTARDPDFTSGQLTTAPQGRMAEAINDDDILFQEEILSMPPVIPEKITAPSMEKITAMIHSMRDQLDEMLRIIHKK